MGLLNKLQSKLDLYRLEQKYTRRTNRQTFTTGAQYIDGEYVYSPSDASSPMSASSTGSNNSGSGKRRSHFFGQTAR